MPRQRVTVVAGPPGSGKSSRFPLSSFKVDWFNADDRAAELNLGSFRKISSEIQAQVNMEFQRWILDHISARHSFAIETTLRSPITFEQSRLAREHGFWTAMEYVMAGESDNPTHRDKRKHSLTPLPRPFWPSSHSNSALPRLITAERIVDSSRFSCFVGHLLSIFHDALGRSDGVPNGRLRSRRRSSIPVR